MKLRKLALAAAAAALLASGCGRQAAGDTAEFSPSESGLYLTSDGGITSAAVESYENDYYSAEELQAYVEEALERFNGPDGAIPEGQEKEAPPARFNRCSFDEKTKMASLLIDFRDAESYLRFQEEYPDGEENTGIQSLEIMTVKEAAEKGAFSEVSLVTADSEQKAVSPEEAAKKGKLMVAAIQGTALVQTEGSLKYVSEGTELEGSSQARISGDGISYLIYE